MEKKPKPKKRTLDLVLGLFFIASGGYKLYNAYFNNVQYETYRLVLTYVILILGIYNLYKYFVLSEKNEV